MFKRWSKPNGYRQVLSISLPLVISMSTMTIMQFTDRIFLANYSIDSISAALPAGVAYFTIIYFFLGVAIYVNAFVSQYFGAQAFFRIGAALWQGIYFSIFSSIAIAAFYFLAEPLFNFIGHSPHIRTLEITYFKILILGGGITIISTVFSCFYSGRGMNWTVMSVNITGALINIPLSYSMINGVGPFPEMGITGAALATIIASLSIALTYCFLIFRPSNRLKFGTWNNRNFDKELFQRFMHFGLPSGIQMFLEILGFTFFVLILGRIGDIELAASNIVFSIQSLAFWPMAGFHIGNATLVGQAIGRGKPEDGIYSTNSAFHITLAYMGLLSVLFVVFPEPLLQLFRTRGENPAQYQEIMNYGVILLRFVALFCLFDSMNLVFSSTIKGAGDTRFIMWTIAVLTFGLMGLPLFIAVELLHGGLYTAWSISLFFSCTLGMAFFLRYRNGKWKKMHVIETQLIEVAANN